MNTERLVLRPWPAGDITAVTQHTRRAHWADDFPAEGDRVIAEHPETLGQSQIIECAGGLVVGSIGLFWPPADGAVEIGYGIVPSRRGRGYAAEATRALADHALTEPNVHTVYANVELSNPPSVRVLEKAGFQLASSDGGTARYHLK